MKKFLAITLLLAFIVMPSVAMAASSVKCSYTSVDDHRAEMVYEWTAHTDGSVTSATCDIQISGSTTKVLHVKGYAHQIDTDPGSTAPTDNYDITITNPAGIDIANGLLANRDTSTAESIFVGYAANGALTLNISGNSVNGATGTVTVSVWTDVGPPASNGSTTIPTSSVGLALSYNGVDCGTADPCNLLAAPTSGNQYRIYAVRWSRADASTADDNIECSGGTLIEPAHSVSAGKKTGFNDNPNYITCPVDEYPRINFGTASTDASASIRYTEVTP